MLESSSPPKPWRRRCLWRAHARASQRSLERVLVRVPENRSIASGSECRRYEESAATLDSIRTAADGLGLRACLQFRAETRISRHEDCPKFVLLHCRDLRSSSV